MVSTHSSISENLIKPTLSLSRCIQVFDNAFDASFCDQMIQSFQSLARFQKANGAGISAGHDTSAWTELDITPLTDPSFRKLILDNMYAHLQCYNQALSQPIAIPPTERLDQLVIKRYRPSTAEHFQVHFDSIGPVANRYLVFLWYLNDVESGGATYFPALDICVQPKKGRLLMFPPYWMFQHEGRAPISGDKYIFSTYYLF